MYVCTPCECSACRSQKVSSNPLQELQMMVPYHVGVNDPRFSASKTKCSGWPWTSVIPLPQLLWAGINGMSHHTLRAVSHLSRPNQPLGLISHYGSWRLLSFSFFLFFFFMSSKIFHSRSIHFTKQENKKLFWWILYLNNKVGTFEASKCATVHAHQLPGDAVVLKPYWVVWAWTLGMESSLYQYFCFLFLVSFSRQGFSV